MQYVGKDDILPQGLVREQNVQVLQQSLHPRFSVSRRPIPSASAPFTCLSLHELKIC